MPTTLDWTANPMSKDYSIDGLRKFLDSAAHRGFMARETANARKTAVEKILSVLDASELLDMRQVDLESATERFMNLQGTEYKPQSLRVYASRLKSAVSEFLVWVENPSAYKPNSKRSKSPSTRNPLTRANANQTVEPTQKPDKEEIRSTTTTETLSIPVPIRSGLQVTIQGIPADMTAEESEKLANVIRAFGALMVNKD